MKTLNINNSKVVTDLTNSYFRNNRFMIGTSIPTEGSYNLGDIIINTSETSLQEPMWICIESGTPGAWQVFNASGEGGGGRTVCLRNQVIIDSPASVIDLGIGTFDRSKDTLMVFINADYAYENVDYRVSGTTIVAVDKEWNKVGMSDFTFDFVVFKSILDEGLSSSTELIYLKDYFVLEEDASEIIIGIDNYCKDTDILNVYKNSVYLTEDVDYITEFNTMKSLKGNWTAGDEFTFTVIKQVAKLVPDAVVYSDNIVDGSVTMNKLNSDVKQAIENASNIDLSGYVEQSEYDTKISELENRVDGLFQDVDNGKNLIATSIGNPLINGNSTFKAMSEAILGLRRNTENETDAREVLYNMMIEDNYSQATSEMTIDELIELLDDSDIKLDEIAQISCGYAHAMIIKNDGSLWACGNNSTGQLGLNDKNNRTTFTQVTTNINNDVKQVACGDNFTIILKDDGSVWGSGYNGYRSLGLGDNVDRTTFTKATTNVNNDVKQIACGHRHTMILKNDGSLWSCGYNDNGELGLNDTSQRTTFTQVTTNVNNDVKFVTCGMDYTFIIKNDGSLWGCGYNSNGNLGLGTYDSDPHKTFTQVTTNINNDVKEIACGNGHTIIIKNDGSLWGCGRNDYGQVGLNNTTTRITTFTQLTTNVNNDVKQVSCGWYHTMVLKNDGSVWTCGWNAHGQLGLSNNDDKSVLTKANDDCIKIACGSYYIFMVKNDNSLLSSGDNYAGQLGLGDVDRRNELTQVQIPSSPINEYEISRLKLYYYLLDNEIEVTEDMDINTMLDLLVDDYINNMLISYENTLRIILTNKGISATEEDDMGDLINKVDTINVCSTMIADATFDNANRFLFANGDEASTCTGTTGAKLVSFTYTFFFSGECAMRVPLVKFNSDYSSTSVHVEIKSKTGEQLFYETRRVTNTSSKQNYDFTLTNIQPGAILEIYLLHDGTKNGSSAWQGYKRGNIGMYGIVQ